MNPDFAIVLNFKLKSAKDVDADFLVKTARNIGARAVSVDAHQTDFKKACAKYTIALVDAEAIEEGCELAPADPVAKLVANRKDGQKTIINIPVTDNGKLPSATEEMLKQINNWMHLFGHAFNEGEPCTLKTSGVAENNAFVLQNRHVHYQKYLFIKAPLPETIKVHGLINKPNRIEMIENRTELDFTFADDELNINLKDVPESDFTWQVIRIQEHRPEDDIKETKY